MPLLTLLKSQPKSVAHEEREENDDDSDEINQCLSLALGDGEKAGETLISLLSRDDVVEEGFLLGLVVESWLNVEVELVKRDSRDWVSHLGWLLIAR